MKFGEEKQAEIFKKLAYGSAYQVGLEYGFDKVYSSAVSIRNAVTAIKAKIKNHPDRYEKYGINKEVLELVAAASAQRNVDKRPTQVSSIVEQSINKDDIKALVTSIRDKSFSLIDRKLDMVSKSRKKLDNISFKELGVIAGISFDKGQILKGEATENIAVMARVDKKLSHEDALEMVAKLREKNTIANELRNK